MSKVQALKIPEELQSDDEVDIVPSPTSPVMSVVSNKSKSSSIKSLSLEDLQDHLAELQLEEETIATQIKSVKLKIKRMEKLASSPTTTGFFFSYFIKYATLP